MSEKKNLTRKSQKNSEIVIPREFEKGCEYSMVIMKKYINIVNTSSDKMTEWPFVNIAPFVDIDL